MKIVFATSNKNKIKEVQELMPQGIELISLQDIGCLEDIPETSPTIEGNALQKANYIQENYGYNCFADDTGLEVEALDGAPGVLSARYAGEAKDPEANMTKLLSALQGVSNRQAQFKTVIALCIDNKTHTFTGICKGTITIEKRGLEGFGYDPLFSPEGFEETFAEMPLTTKNEIGHRGKAVQQLIAFLNHQVG
ncbi:non-canonical purine NTP diphosphatase [Aquimarina brevivitae]|uniref:dITP/XTP pyrophosphatase n=1 Tax=Aquimarina brevivitae TaxID=323412 RepID=A0A4Q7NTS3_9FLAO|nr:non-canonical purine NTP diphosphatase [Aquimarina brevivitae]RZS90495.1 XTP/dITP diphosphohydrolase [Aquimarina brevivitae]